MTMVSELQVTPVKPVNGLVGFASLVLDGSLYLGSIAIHTRLDGRGHRITYPTKKIGERQLNIYHPVNKEMGELIERSIANKCHELFEEEAN